MLRAGGITAAWPSIELGNVIGNRDDQLGTQYGGGDRKWHDGILHAPERHDTARRCLMAAMAETEIEKWRAETCAANPASGLEILKIRRWRPDGCGLKRRRDRTGWL